LTTIQIKIISRKMKMNGTSPKARYVVGDTLP